MSKQKKRLLEQKRERFNTLKQKYVDMYIVYRISVKPKFLRY